jgi:Spy/CpxP family protein refolding chaperone
MNNFKNITMKKGIFVLLIMLIFSGVRLAAQNTNLDKLYAYKIGFFTKRLNLTSQEAEKFWPVYNEYQKQKNSIQQEKMKLIKDFNQNESTLSDNQISETGDKLVASIVQESNLAVTFHKKLKEVLTPAKVIRFYQAENQFKAQLINELQGTRQQQRPMPKRDF